MKKCLTVYFSGLVQGVGFRFTAQRIARRFEVAGYVRNQPDGKVKLAAEGEEEVLRDFVQALRESSLKSYIREVDLEWSDRLDHFQTFEIVV